MCTVHGLLLLFALVAAGPALGQRQYIARWDACAGYALLDSPKVSLFDQGVQQQFGMRGTCWSSLCLDYSLTRGRLTLTPDLLPDERREKLAAHLSALIGMGLIPATYALPVPVESRTQAFASGSQFAFRRWKPVTVFIRPSKGAIYDRTYPRPVGAFAKAAAAQLAPAATKRHWTGFCGVGGGFDFSLTRRFLLRAQADLVWDHQFNDILKSGRRIADFSSDPAFQWDPNMAQ